MEGHAAPSRRGDETVAEQRRGKRTLYSSGYSNAVRRAFVCCAKMGMILGNHNTVNFLRDLESYESMNHASYLT